MTKPVHPTPAGTSGHLLEFVWNQGSAPAAIPLAHPADDDGSSGHIDAESQRVGRENDLHQPAAEKHLNQLLEHWQ
jgi:hypothetical protein